MQAAANKIAEFVDVQDIGIARVYKHRLSLPVTASVSG